MNHNVSELTRDKIRKKRTGSVGHFKHTEEYKKNLSIRNIGNTYGSLTKGIKRRPKTAEEKEIISKKMLNVPKTEQHKKNISLGKKGKKKATTMCPHCFKIGSTNNMKRWHFENCKILWNVVAI